MDKLPPCRVCNTEPHTEPQRHWFKAYCHHKGCPLYFVRFTREEWLRLHAARPEAAQSEPIYVFNQHGRMVGFAFR